MPSAHRVQLLSLQVRLQDGRLFLIFPDLLFILLKVRMVRFMPVGKVTAVSSVEAL
jgi:hypothetical protein